LEQPLKVANWSTWKLNLSTTSTRQTLQTRTKIEFALCHHPMCPVSDVRAVAPETTGPLSSANYLVECGDDFTVLGHAVSIPNVFASYLPPRVLKAPMRLPARREIV